MPVIEKQYLVFTNREAYTHFWKDSEFKPLTKQLGGIIFIPFTYKIRNRCLGIIYKIVHIFSWSPILKTSTDIRNPSAIPNLIIYVKRPAFRLHTPCTKTLSTP